MEYVSGSSFPYALEFKEETKALIDYLEGLYNTIVVKDITAHRKITDTMMLRSVIQFDFVVKAPGTTMYIQAAATVRDEAVLRRELAPLEKISDNYPKMILTLDDDPKADYEGIMRLNALDWLMGND